MGIDGGGQDDVEFEEAGLFGPGGRQKGSPVATEAGSTAATERAESLEGTVPFVSDVDPEKAVPGTPPLSGVGFPTARPAGPPDPNDFASIQSLQMSMVMIEVTSNINKQISSEMEKVMIAFTTSASEQNQKVEELKDVVATVERKVDTKLKSYEKNMKLIEQKNEKRAKGREAISVGPGEEGGREEDRRDVAADRRDEREREELASGLREEEQQLGPSLGLGPPGADRPLGEAEHLQD